MNLKDSFPSLSMFSDMDWSAVMKEYEPSSKFITFPEYLALKAEEGDCPHHIFELAYFDAALMGLQDGEFVFPETPGIYLNPSAAFLSLDHDILKMVSDAHEGKINIIERQNVLCVFANIDGEVVFHELTRTDLEILQELENGRVGKDNPAITPLLDIGLVISAE